MTPNTIALIPIDHRPVCYDLPKQVIAITDKYELFVPPIDFLGGLVSPANKQNLLNWLKNLPRCDYTVISLDTLVWGG